MWLGRLWSCDLGGQECPDPHVTFRGRGRPRHIFDTRSSLPRGSAQETKSGRPAQGLAHLGNLSGRTDFWLTSLLGFGIIVFVEGRLRTAGDGAKVIGFR